MREEHALAVEVVRTPVVSCAGDLRDADLGAAAEEEVDLGDFGLLCGFLDVEFDVACHQGAGGVGRSWGVRRVVEDDAQGHFVRLGDT